MKTVVAHVMWALLMLLFAAQVHAATDIIAVPDPVREYVSPSGQYRLVIRRNETRASISVFNYQDGVNVSWSSEIAHRFGPRFAFVSDNGQVILVDEWLNRFTDHAVTVFDSSGKVIASYSTDDIAQTLSATRQHVHKTATIGAWIQSQPVFDQSAHAVLFKCADKPLLVDVATGLLSVVTEAEEIAR
ncbi:hypothetical protein LJ739_05515 [Aestuariibacter halophilus]|uniref:Uncharacterized protein n=1 Tax=Fluctibacter halophilus TaxID=226011 RepID=A0ABS8G5L1_9ALTE|nr:hypothetical protein [Aestuariibacter halophilus]MCC2615693.1 hypothetical protein [Aestuariibacter halophilus]